MTDKEKYVLGKYEITITGEIYKNLTNGTRIKLKFREDKDGYYNVNLIYNDNGDRQPFRVHRLVALKYIPNTKNLPVTNHKDLDKKNNHISNLEWCDVKYNTQHGYDNCAYEHIQKVKVTEPDGNIHIFPSISHASRYYGYANPSVIQAILNGREYHMNPITRGKRKGLYFEYTNEGVTTIERNTATASRV